MRNEMLLLAALLAAPLIATSAEPAGLSSQSLYDMCIDFEASQGGSKLTGSQMTKAAICTSYLQGAFQAYNWATAAQCDLTPYTPLDLTRRFMSAHRAAPPSVRKQEAQAVVGMVLDTCFCGKNAEIKKQMCGTD